MGEPKWKYPDDKKVDALVGNDGEQAGSVSQDPENGGIFHWQIGGWAYGTTVSIEDARQAVDKNYQGNKGRR